jgi:hypothetical protein
MARGTKLGRLLCGVGLVGLLVVLPAWSGSAYAAQNVLPSLSSHHFADSRRTDSQRTGAPRRATVQVTAFVPRGDVAVVSQSSHARSHSEALPFGLAMAAAMAAWVALGVYLTTRTGRGGPGSTRIPRSLRRRLAHEAELWLREQ